ncbi:universal stress protein [Candidatus Nitrosotalea okcheonensis]|uniref:UspA domain-containing protein n=1 Tax=Candidatus Nitrosotalea okcheonensis TaxID=1903276 RepID=A0A2H1FI28_9ARCH|nr:universal stress protein [Candidatus Nitrosotalea okcheonensis]MDE1877550.1 universal stress protein [Nitrososphaerota archaeon]SMH72418.1 UspA domain-containing protein [Candidatus Nitrosotalea okcheonensis]
MIKNILVPVDGSKYSVKAFNFALDIAKKYGAKISVLACLEKENISAWCINKNAHIQIIKDAEKFAMDFISELEKTAKDVNVPLSVHVIETKSISKQIINFATSKKIDLIVMGSHGRTGFNQFVLGSVSNAVCHSAKCPVLIIK